MNTPEELKTLVKEKYGEIAKKSAPSSSCCSAESANCCSDTDFTVLSEDYTKLKGYNPDADLGLGCGLPTEFAKIKGGDTVIDLGSGAGNDVFIVRNIVGDKGKVIGIDMTKEMIEKARINNNKLGYENVEFRLGDIESLPLENNSADVVVSNCVLNLVPDKVKAFAEIYRILKPGGHFSVSDIVTTTDLPGELKKAAELYAGCVSGAITKDEYIGIIEKSGFKNIKVQRERKIELPDELIERYLNEDDVKKFNTLDTKILSINVFAQKPV